MVWRRDHQLLWGQDRLTAWGRSRTLAPGVNKEEGLVSRSNPCSGRSNQGTHEVLVPGSEQGTGLLPDMASSVLPNTIQVALSCPAPGLDSEEQTVDDTSWCSSVRPGTGIGREQKLPEELIAALV